MSYRREFGLILMGAAFALFGLLFAAALSSCDSGGTYSPQVPNEAACDTMMWTSEHGEITSYFYKITCVYPETVLVEVPCDTVFVPSPPDTVYVPVDIGCPPCLPDTVYIEPDWSCVRECLEINGLGHWRECFGVCVPAR